MRYNELFPNENLMESTSLEADIAWLENRIKHVVDQAGSNPTERHIEYLESLERSLRDKKEQLAQSRTLRGKVTGLLNRFKR